MAITEKQRHHLFTTLESKLGSEDAAVLMEHLPPVGWADVATKADLVHVDRRFDSLERRIDGLERRMDGFETGMRSYFLALLTSQVGLTALLYNLLS